MSRYISDAMRQKVKERANHCCEYCLIHQDDFFLPFEIDHIISLRHEGKSVFSNLALSCGTCNRMKAADIGTYLNENLEFIRLFNPRIDRWFSHFEINHGEILPITPIAQATIKLLDLNNPDRIILRQLLMTAKRYPLV
jgi:HNH endonuclease